MATAAPLQPAAPRRGIKALLARYPLVSFFVMAYAFSWIVWAPWVLGEDGTNVLLPALSVPSSAARLLVAGGILAGPTLSAFIMTATTEGREGVRRLLGRLQVVPVRPHRRPPDHALRHDGLLDGAAEPWGPRWSFLLAWLSGFLRFRDGLGRTTA
jgi:hypothetical protein